VEPVSSGGPAIEALLRARYEVHVAPRGGR
jgi:hypothetical protein